jgi:PKHD-type hydroxylase
MLLRIPAVLTKDEVTRCRRLVDGAEWVDGRVTAGHQSMRVKDNEQVREDHPAAREAGDIVLDALARQPLFMSAALPLKVFPPLFNRYAGGQTFGDHVDNAVRQVTNGSTRVRTDLSSTLFLTAPEDYDGGELVIEDTYGSHAVKLPEGDLILYPASSLHHVQPVTRGARVCSFFWTQSMVRDDAQRALLFDMDRSIMKLSSERPDDPAVVMLTACYHNLIRMWAET